MLFELKNRLKKYLSKKKLFFLNNNFLVFLVYFDALILKIILKNKKILF